MGPAVFMSFKGADCLASREGVYVVRMPAGHLEHWCLRQTLIGQLSPDHRAPGTFQSGVDGMWVLRRMEFFLVAVKLGA